jgi:hypothetical protein
MIDVQVLTSDVAPDSITCGMLSLRYYAAKMLARSFIKKPSNHCSSRFSGVNGGMVQINTNKKGDSKMKQSINAPIIFLVGLVLLTGCSLKYNLTHPLIPLQNTNKLLKNRISSTSTIIGKIKNSLRG